MRDQATYVEVCVHACVCLCVCVCVCVCVRCACECVCERSASKENLNKGRQRACAFKDLVLLLCIWLIKDAIFNLPYRVIPFLNTYLVKELKSVCFLRGLPESSRPQPVEG